MKCVLRTNPREPQFPGRPWCIIKRSQGTSSSLPSYFSLFCSLMWDIRAYSSSPESHSEHRKRNTACCHLHILCPFSDNMLDRKQLQLWARSIFMCPHSVCMQVTDKRCNFRNMDDGQCAVFGFCVYATRATAQMEPADTLNACHSEMFLNDCH